MCSSVGVAIDAVLLAGGVAGPLGTTSFQLKPAFPAPFFCDPSLTPGMTRICAAILGLQPLPHAQHRKMCGLLPPFPPF